MILYILYYILIYNIHIPCYNIPMYTITIYNLWLKIQDRFIKPDDAHPKIWLSKVMGVPPNGWFMGENTMEKHGKTIYKWMISGVVL